MNECSSTNGCVQGFENLWYGKFRSTSLSDAAQDGYAREAQLFLSDTLALNLNKRCSALVGAARKQLAKPLPFIASGAAVGFIRCLFVVFKGTHGLAVPPRHGTFLLKKQN